MQIGVNGFDHQVVIVSLEKKDYVVDVGFGGQVRFAASSMRLSKLYRMLIRTVDLLDACNPAL